MAGRVPDEVAKQFAADTFGLKTHELAEKYEIAISTAKDWRLDAKRRLGLEIGYGTGQPTTEEPVIRGLTAADRHDVEAIWEKVFAAQDATVALEQERRDQYIELPNEPCGVAYLSDIHFGAGGTDYRTARRDGEIIRNTEGLYAGYHGDGFNNWIVGKLQALQRNEALTLDEEIALFFAYIEMIGPKLLWSVAGNHENWTNKLAGVDLVRKATQNTLALYDEYEIVFDLHVGPSMWRHKVRHKWKYGSVFNITHGIEVGWQRGEDEFDIGLGGHTHIGTVCRPFFRHGLKRYAVLTGTYKVDDDFGRELGFPSPQGVGAGVMLYHPDGRTLFIDDVETAAEFLAYWRA